MKIALALRSVLVAYLSLELDAFSVKVPRTTRLETPSNNSEFAVRRSDRACVPKVSLKFSKTPARGDAGGTNFDDLNSLRYDEELKEIEICSAARIDKTSFKTKYASYKHEGNGGSPSKFFVRANEKIAKIKTCIGKHNGTRRVFFLGFTLNTGKTFNAGQTTSTCYTSNIPGDKVVVAGHGRSASELDRIGLVLRTPMCD